MGFQYYCPTHKNDEVECNIFVRKHQASLYLCPHIEITHMSICIKAIRNAWEARKARNNKWKLTTTAILCSALPKDEKERVLRVRKYEESETKKYEDWLARLSALLAVEDSEEDSEEELEQELEEELEEEVEEELEEEVEEELEEEVEEVLAEELEEELEEEGKKKRKRGEGDDEEEESEEQRQYEMRKQFYDDWWRSQQKYESEEESEEE